VADPVVVWHRSDLRTADNAALATAAETGDPVPVFVVEPRYFAAGLACDARLAFLLESLADLRDQYRDCGGDLLLLHGEATERLAALCDRLDAEVYFNRDATAGAALERDRTVQGWERSQEFADDGLVDADGFADDGRPRSRVGWDEQCEAYFEADPHPRPESLLEPPAESDLSLAAVRDRYDVDPDKRNVPEGGTVAGRERLSAFCERVASYPQFVSPPAAAEERSSRLGPYLAFGCLSPREVYQAVGETPAGRGRSMFRDRLFWNRHYKQKLVDWPGAFERAINPVFRGLHRGNRDPELIAAWKEGRTGFPLVDAAMRALVETGYVNFRMRAMVASVYGYLLAQPWKEGADFLYYHLLDADPGINHEQWQAQTNLTGAHPVRIYDPAKQFREYDPDGEYVRRYVPELAPVPDEHLPRPDRMPKPLQQELGVVIGEDYPAPVVDYEAAATEARALHDRLVDRAREAFEDPEIRRRASVSNRRLLGDGDGNGGADDRTPARGDDQASLDEFGGS
jgi:deoxyribodipyrimidine photo-lyase